MSTTRIIEHRIIQQILRRRRGSGHANEHVTFGTLETRLRLQDSEGVRQRSLLIEAYRQFRDFEDAWLHLVEPLRAFRFVFYAAWIARRWEDSAFPAAFPHFGTADYWENETRDLEEQVERISSGRDEVTPGGKRREDAEPDIELSNKDFFWDL